MQKGDVVVGGLVPTEQDAPETVQPTVPALHYPTPGIETGFLLDGLRTFAATADAGGEAELVQGKAHPGKVVAPVINDHRD